MDVLLRKIDEALTHMEIEDLIEGLRDSGWTVAEGPSMIMAWKEFEAMSIDVGYNSKSGILVRLAKEGHIEVSRLEDANALQNLLTGGVHRRPRAKDNPDLARIISTILSKTGTTIQDWALRFADTDDEFTQLGIGIDGAGQLGFTMRLKSDYSTYFNAIVEDYVPPKFEVMMSMRGRRATVVAVHEPVEVILPQIERFIDPPREPSRTSFD